MVVVEMKGSGKQSENLESMKINAIYTMKRDK